MSAKKSRRHLILFFILALSSIPFHNSYTLPSSSLTILPSIHSPRTSTTSLYLLHSLFNNAINNNNANLEFDPTFQPPNVQNDGQIEEQACIDAASKMKRIFVPVSTDIHPSGKVGISYIHWPGAAATMIKPFSKKKPLPVLLVHGFDSSCLEYRRLGPKLSSLGIDTYAVDLLGWGYTNLQNVSSFSARAKVDALSSFWNQISAGKQQKVCIAGASLGGAAAIEYAASSSPSVIQAMILIDAQGFVDGVGPVVSILPPPLARLGVNQVLKSEGLRMAANKMSYYDVDRFATEDAMRIGRYHCLVQGEEWCEALVDFIRSGGFRPKELVEKVEVESLVISNSV